jgi:hypothetical protein
MDEWKNNMKDINKKMQEDVPLTPEQQKEFKKQVINGKMEEYLGGKLTFGKK